MACDYCETDRDDYVKPLDKNGHLFICYGGMEQVVLYLSANRWHGSVPINYCPICGRNLRKRKDGEG